MDAVMLARQRMLEREMEHAEGVAKAICRAEDLRKARQNAKAKRAWERKSAEEKAELTRRKRARMKELHGEGYYVEHNRAWHRTERGKACVKSYNGSEGHRKSARKYRQKKMEEDREGFLLKERERAARARRTRRVVALMAMLGVL